MLKLADELTRARAEVLVRFRLKDSPALKNVGVSSLRTSMRNQFPAVIEKLKIGSAQVRLILSNDDTHYIRASCTKESAQLLGLREGKHVLALCKATAVDISADNPSLDESRASQIVGDERARRHGGRRADLRLTAAGRARDARLVGDDRANARGDVERLKQLVLRQLLIFAQRQQHRRQPEQQRQQPQKRPTFLPAFSIGRQLP